MANTIIWRKVMTTAASVGPAASLEITWHRWRPNDHHQSATGISFRISILRFYRFAPISIRTQKAEPTPTTVNFLPFGIVLKIVGSQNEISLSELSSKQCDDIDRKLIPIFHCLIFSLWALFYCSAISWKKFFSLLFFFFAFWFWWIESSWSKSERHQK